MNKPTVTSLENSNIRIWEKICETDPSRTKNFTKGYRGTAINPTYIYEKLTACFGPCGTGWGFDIIKDEYKDGYEKDGEKEISHSTTVGLWYKIDGGNKSEPIPGIGGTAYVFKDKNGWHTDEDASKKSLTDALTKAAQLLGMSADIFSGMYEDCKYVAGLKRKYSQEESPEEPTTDNSKQTPQNNKPAETATQTATQTALSKKKTSASSGDSGAPIVTGKQAKAIYAMFMKADFSMEQMKEYLSFHFNEPSNYKASVSTFKVIKGLADKGELKPMATA